MKSVLTWWRVFLGNETVLRRQITTTVSGDIDSSSARHTATASKVPSVLPRVRVTSRCGASVSSTSLSVGRWGIILSKSRSAQPSDPVLRVGSCLPQSRSWDTLATFLAPAADSVPRNSDRRQVNTAVNLRPTYEGARPPHLIGNELSGGALARLPVAHGVRTHPTVAPALHSQWPGPPCLPESHYRGISCQRCHL